jgi:hypothetical protein
VDEDFDVFVMVDISTADSTQVGFPRQFDLTSGLDPSRLIGRLFAEFTS